MDHRDSRPPPPRPAAGSGQTPIGAATAGAATSHGGRLGDPGGAGPAGGPTRGPSAGRVASTAGAAGLACSVVTGLAIAWGAQHPSARDLGYWLLVLALFLLAVIGMHARDRARRLAALEAYAERTGTALETLLALPALAGRRPARWPTAAERSGAALQPCPRCRLRDREPAGWCGPCEGELAAHPSDPAGPAHALCAAATADDLRTMVLLHMADHLDYTWPMPAATVGTDVLKRLHRLGRIQASRTVTRVEAAYDDPEAPGVTWVVTEHLLTLRFGFGTARGRLLSRMRIVDRYIAETCTYPPLEYRRTPRGG